jgi:hypothetical protein
MARATPWSKQGGSVRERGVQSRRGRGPTIEGSRRPGPPPRRGGNFWQALAIVALIAATAGWTTVAVLALRDTSVAEASPSDSVEPLPSDDSSLPPVADSHDVPDLEPLLPTQLNSTALKAESWTGDTVLTGDNWSVSMTSFLTRVGKGPTDLQVAQAYDPTQNLDGSVGIYRVPGVDATKVRDALVQAWKGDSPDLKVSQVTLGGKEVTKGDFGTDSVNSYLYVTGDLVYDIETSDETIATAALNSLPAAPSGSPAVPSSSGSPRPSVSPKASG